MKLAIKGFTVEIDYYFIAMLTLMTVVFKNENIVLCFLFCILHELGHFFAMLALGQRIRKIVFGYFGVRIECDTATMSGTRETIVAAAGPLVNLALAIVFCVLGKQNELSLNLSLFIFNLLPVKMLDGGRILSHFFSYTFMKTVGIIVGIVLLILGVVIIHFTRSNFIFLIVSIYILLGTLK